MPIKSVSTQQAGQVLDVNHYLLVSSTPVLIFDIEGEVTSTTGTNYYIQLLGTATPNSGVTVPLFSRLAVTSIATSGQNGFSFVYRPQGLDTSTMNYPETAIVGGSNSSPVYLAISSTDNVYTAVAASTQVAVNFEDTYQEFPNLVITGDLSTGCDALQVYDDGNPDKRLLQFQALLTVGANPSYLMLFGYKNPTNGALPLQQWKVTPGVANMITKRFNAGLFTMQGNPSTYVKNTGCFLYGSTTTQYLTASVASAWNMKAWYIQL